MIRFTRTETVHAVQFTGDWEKLAASLGLTPEALTTAWPKVDRDFDGTMYSPPRHGRKLSMHPINVGDWVIVEDGEITSFATQGWFDDWERSE